MPDSDRRAMLANPHMRLSGPVDQDMYDNFRKQLEACPPNEPIVITITTLGSAILSRESGVGSRE